jgi:hypothetical protein
MRRRGTGGVKSSQTPLEGGRIIIIYDETFLSSSINDDEAHNYTVIYKGLLTVNRRRRRLFPLLVSGILWYSIL